METVSITDTIYIKFIVVLVVHSLSHFSDAIAYEMIPTRTEGLEGGRFLLSS